MNLKETWPGIVIQDTVKQTKFPLDQSLEYSEAMITAYITDFVAGKLSPSLKSAAAPEENTGPVKIVVGTNMTRSSMTR
jgi:protein disulfide-isomerase A1